jgi:DNA-binding transcriptional LysR family regulator
VTIEVNDVHTLLALVAHNLGVALVPERIAAKRGDHVTVALTPGSAADWQVSVASPRRTAASLAAEALSACSRRQRSTRRKAVVPPRVRRPLCCCYQA